jgi:hypothetical protein
MIAGHFGFAAIVKARAPRVPFAILAFASVWLDVVFVPLFVAGIEPIKALPGTHGGYGEAIIHASWTHSLVGALVLSAVLGLVAAWRWGRTAGTVVGAVAFSHWVLDLIVHRADMPLLPWTAPVFGFGLWRLPWVAIAVELALVAVGTFLYGRAATARNARRGAIATVAMLGSGLLTLVLSVTGN